MKQQIIVIVGQLRDIIMQQRSEMIAERVKGILTKIQQARLKHKINHQVQLVAVSKTKPVEDIKAAYDQGLRHFGQNYAEEVQEKHHKLPEDIRWHFIGHLQSNKIKKILVPNLHLLQSLDRQRYSYIHLVITRVSLAQKLEKQLSKNERNLNVLLQVKTSEEQSKSGVDPVQLDSLYTYVKEKCPHLIFRGLMTIGKQGDSVAFEKMRNLRVQMCNKHGLSAEQFQLSMGMSSDFEQAIGDGSTMVRVGTSIFGERNYKK